MWELTGGHSQLQDTPGEQVNVAPKTFKDIPFVKPSNQGYKVQLKPPNFTHTARNVQPNTDLNVHPNSPSIFNGNSPTKVMKIECNNRKK